MKNEEDQNENEKEIKRIIAKFVEKSDNKHLKDAMLFEFTKKIQPTNVNPIFLRDAIFIQNPFIFEILQIASIQSSFLFICCGLQF